MSTPSVLSANKQLATDAGYLDVNKVTLQHNRFSNIYGLGDCTSLPIPKTAAAIGEFATTENLVLIMLTQNQNYSFTEQDTLRES